MRSTGRSLGVASVVLTAVLVAGSARVVGAQQLTAPRLARATSAAATAPASTALAAAPAAVPRDSVARYLHAARVQRVSGGTLVTAGFAAVTIAFIQYARSGDMRMGGMSAATFVAGAGLGLAGGTRLVVSRESFAIAARWKEAQVAARR